MTGKDCAEVAMKLAEGEAIPYVLGGENEKGLDCQGLIEYVVRQTGGRMSFRGSNDMFRNACALVTPLKGHNPTPGCVLFIVSQDGNEPSQYKADGLGNARHIGWYTGGRYEVVHASSSKGRVVPSTLKNGWTHIGWLKNVDYSTGGGNMDTIKRGDKGSGVKLIQEALLSLGYPLPRYGADGDYGAETEAAVNAFLADNGLPATGVWDGEADARAKERLSIIAEPTDKSRLLTMIDEAKAKLDALRAAISVG
jgi:hypothetical protein